MRKQAQVSERNCLEPVIHEEPGLDLRAHPACFTPVLLFLATFLVGVAGERTAFAYGRNPHPWLVLRKLPFVSKSEPECVCVLLVILMKFQVSQLRLSQLWPPSIFSGEKETLCQEFIM